MDAVLRRSVAALVPGRVAAAAAASPLLPLPACSPLIGPNVGWPGETEVLWFSRVPKTTYTAKTGHVACP